MSACSRAVLAAIQGERGAVCILPEQVAFQQPGEKLGPALSRQPPECGMQHQPVLALIELKPQHRLVEAQGAGAAVVESEGVGAHGMTGGPDQRVGAICGHEIAP
jgi:hypothetical protein